MTEPIVFSHVQASALLHARAAGRTTAPVSFDLGLSMTEVTLDQQGISTPERGIVGWGDIETIARQPQACFVVGEEGTAKIQAFSPEFNRVYSLYPTVGAPTMLISGIPMHRVKDVDPMEDTRRKLKALAPVRGVALDTCTGLGYTAILLARSARLVHTIELDPAVLDIARLNPWSRMLFTAANITQHIGDALDQLESFPTATFDAILHDPPMFSLAGHLYSTECYRELRRVLKAGGRLFHYIGDPESKSGRTITRGANERLLAAGFQRIQRRPDTFGLLAQ